MRKAFTLVEMLVVITIALILIGLTVGVAFQAMDTERTRGAARQVQSFLEGAKSRAAFEQRIYGVRFQMDESGATPRIRSMIYVHEPEPFEEGTIQFEADGVTITGSGTNWRQLEQRGLISQWSRVKIPNDQSGVWMRIEAFGPDWNDPSEPERLVLSRPHPNNPTGSLTCAIQLNPTPAPNQEPISLGKGIVIDLDSSTVPASWRTPDGQKRMDILFTPRGMMADSSMAFGFLHLIVADEGDVEQGRDVRTIERDYAPLIATIRTATGQVSTHSVNVYDGDSNGRADDPFRYSETGR